MSQTKLPTEPALAPMLCVSIHDVAPATWADCLRLVQAIRAVADIPLTWLVVPHYHFRPDQSAQMEACLDAALERGDELALHGYSHLDTEAGSGGLRERFLRNVYTRREGEFAALSEAEARRRLALGLDWFAERGWTPSGFIPPAWLLGEGAWRALRASPFTYTTTFSHFHCLPGPHDSWPRPPAQHKPGSRERRDRRSRHAGTGHSLQDEVRGGRSRQGEGYPSAGARPWERTGSQGLYMPGAYQGAYQGGYERAAEPAAARTAAAAAGTARDERRGQPAHGHAGRDQTEGNRQRPLDLGIDAHNERAAADSARGETSAARRIEAGAAASRIEAGAAANRIETGAAASRTETSALGSVIAHPGRAILSPSLVYAARNRSGRLLSPRVADATAAMLAGSPLVRFSLHPPDARYPELVRHIQHVLERMLTRREAVTKAECARRLTHADGLTSTDPSR